MITSEISRPRQRRVCGLVAACSLFVASLSAASLGAQTLAPRISSDISSAEQATIEGSLNPLAQAKFDTGRLPSGTRLNGITIVFSRTAAQEADLKALIAAQQTPGSPLYHQWLNPDQFAARFGMAESDISAVENWLQQQGFSIDSVARSQNAIHFSGSALQVERAFQTEMHTYKVNGVSHFAPSKAVSMPAAMASAVLGVRNLDDFRPKPHVFFKKSGNARPSFTGAGNSSIFFAPGDIVTAYDVKPVYSAGNTGAGQSITLVGQSAILTSDVEAFESASGLAVKDPSFYLIPLSGSSAEFDGDEAESDLDVEWSGAMAPGATINFVYAGSNPTYGAFDAIIYAIDENIGTIISSSYGTCETALGGATLESSFEQAATQGQTVLAAAGDDGSTDCSGIANLTTAQQEVLAVDYPGSSPNVTSMGGTEISSTADNGDYLSIGNGYWEANTGTTDIVDSVQQYIPEIAWNDDAVSVQNGGGLSSGGGGTSALFPKPAWQTGVPGLSSSITNREVPDLALYASPYSPGYLFCSSDSGVNGPWQQFQQSSCTAGFEDSTTGDLIAAGGTSFDAPIFSGMLALLSQKAGYGAGQGEGLINSTLYSLASTPATYASAFHDITSGNNNCLGGSGFCNGDLGFSAGIGYDQATGLGSVDLANLAAVWPTIAPITPALTATTTTVTASSSSVQVGASVTFTISVAATSGTPSGTVMVTVDDSAPVAEILTSNGTYVYTTTFSTADTHTVFASYGANGSFAGSTASTSVTVTAVSSGKGTFALATSPSTLTVAQGSTGTETISITPAGGYTGTVDLSIDAGSADTTLQNLCWQYSNTDSSGNGIAQISGTEPVSTQLTFNTNAAECQAAGALDKSGMHFLKASQNAAAFRNAGGNQAPFSAPISVAFAGLLLAGFLGRRSRKLRGLACLIVLGAMGLALSACGNNNINGNISNPPKGTYTITVTGQDSATSSIEATSTFTFVIN